MSDLDVHLDDLAAGIDEPGFLARAKAFENELRHQQDADLPHEERDRLWQRYQQIWEEFKARRVTRREAAEREMSTLADALGALEQHVESRIFRSESDRFRGALQEAQNLAGAQRKELWDRCQGLWERHKTWIAKTRVESDMAKSRHIQELWSLDYGHDGSPILQSFSDWENVGHKVREARSRLKTIQDAVRRDTALLPQDREVILRLAEDKWHGIKQAEETTFSVHGQRASQLYNEAATAVECQSPSDAWQILKAHSAELRSLWLRSDDRARYREWFEDLWQRLRAKKDEAKTAWRERQAAGLERLRDARDRLQAARERVQENMRQNESRLADAWSDDYRERVNGWIREEEERERDMKRSLEELERKIRDAEERLQS